MSADMPQPAAATARVDDDAKPRTQRFRRASNAVNLSPEQRRRQAAISQEAWTALGGREPVMAFFNEHHDALGGRPLDLAIDSDDGLARVRAVLAARTG